jgi:arsenate reductase
MSWPLFVGYPRCSTSNKAQKWLDAQGIEYNYRHIVDDKPTVEELRLWHKQSGLPLRRFFNTSGRLYREQNVKSQLEAGLDDAAAFALLASNGLMVKRPLLVGDDFVLVGFNQSEWEKTLGAAN